MATQQQPSLFVRFSGFLLFVSLSMASFFWFGWSLVQVFTQISSNMSVIVFDKGALYLLGVGAGLSVLTYAIFHEVILKLPLTKKLNKRLSVSALISLTIVFVVPHVIHYPIENYLRNQGYRLCEPASYQWLMYRKIVYVTSVSACKMAVENKK